MSTKSPLLELILSELEEMQAIDTITINVQDKTTITDYMVICTGRSTRHVKAIAEKVLEKLKAASLPALSNAGVQRGEWAVLDFGDVVVHVMHPERRSFYNLEGLWQNAS